MPWTRSRKGELDQLHSSIFRIRSFPRNLIGCIWMRVCVVGGSVCDVGYTGVADRVGALGTMGIRYCFGSIVRLLSKRACFSDECVIGYCCGGRWGDDLNCFSLFGGIGPVKGSGISVSWRYVLLCFFSRSSIRVRSLIKKQSIVRYRLKIYIFFFHSIYVIQLRFLISRKGILRKI